MEEAEIINGCLKHDRNYQRLLYERYFNRMMNLSIRYAKSVQEAKEILHGAFKNVFTQLKHFADANENRKDDVPSLSIEDWIKRSVIETAIQHMHNNKREYFVSSTVSMRDAEKSPAAEISDEQIISAVDKHGVMKALHLLTPSYRTVYNMHEVDGYSHAEISKLLDISEFTSRDNLSKAKFNFRKNLTKMISK
ncbi:MAG: RNA polymerase sigma factor [Bacteroidia bacterium]